MKINKFLDQVVNAAHVANVLTEEEIDGEIERMEVELEDVIKYIEKQQKYKKYAESLLETLKKAREKKLVGNSAVKSLSNEAREFWQGRMDYFNDELSYIEIIVNKEKKTIVALSICGVTGRVYSRSVAKCHPDDEWDEDIGKAIAVGRALGVDVDRFTEIPSKEPLPDNSFVHTTPDGKTYRVVKRRAKVGERVVIIDDLTLDAFKVGDVEEVNEQSASKDYEVIGRRELGFRGFDYLDHKRDYYVIIEELPF